MIILNTQNPYHVIDEEIKNFVEDNKQELEQRIKNKLNLEDLSNLSKKEYRKYFEEEEQSFFKEENKKLTKFEEHTIKPYWRQQERL